MRRLIYLTLIVFFAFAENSVSQTVYVTKSGKKYHSYDCRYLSNSSIAISLEEAVSHGYAACKICMSVSSEITDPPAMNSESGDNGYSAESYREKVQCSALTKSGNRCKRMTSNPGGKCWQHQGK